MCSLYEQSLPRLAAGDGGKLYHPRNLLKTRTFRSPRSMEPDGCAAAVSPAAAFVGTETAITHSQKPMGWTQQEVRYAGRFDGGTHSRETWLMQIRIALVFLVALEGCSRAGDSLPEKVGPLPAANAAAEQGMLDFAALDPARDWPWWRGPTRNGVARPDAKPPVRFGDAENVVWRTPVPGRGHSSPIVVGERVYLTTADEAAQVQSVLTFDRATGRQLWQTEVNRGGFPASIHHNNTHATPTLASDGRQLIAAFFNNESVQAA